MTSITDTMFMWIGIIAVILLLFFYAAYVIFKWSDEDKPNDKERAMKIYKRFNDKK